ncbi:hypothetical protein GC173_08320 [bacterium]|nr:hypothetical protein [bacterium]
MTPLRSLLFLATWLLMALTVASCGEKEAPPAPTPAPANTTASIAGQLNLPDGIEAHSVMVFAEGTSFMALTDSEGKFEVSGLKPGKYVLRAARPDLVSQAMAPVEITEADLAKKQPFLTLPPLFMEPIDPSLAGPAQFASRTRGTIRGTVSTQIPGDEMGVSVAVDQIGNKVRTLEDGTYELINVEPGEYTLRFQRPAYAEVEMKVTVAAGEVTEVEPVRLMSAAETVAEEGLQEAAADRVVFGSVDVLLADGTVPNDYSAVRVVLEGTSYSATPDTNGRFEIRNLPAGNYSVAASAVGFILDKKVPVSLRSLEAAEVTLTLLEDTTLSNDSGSLVGRVKFDVLPDGGSAGVSISVGGTSLVGYTDDSGFFSIVNVPPGSYDLTATLVGYRPGRARATVRGGSTPTEVPDMTLERDIKRPEVVYTNPVTGAKNLTILQPTPLVIQFNMPMDTRTVREAIRLVPDVGFNVIAQGGQGGVGSAIYRIDMDAIPTGGRPVLRYGTRYRLTVTKTAASLEGVTMERDFSMEFTTGEPEVIGTDPPDGATDVLLRYDNPIAFYFNAAIDPESVTIDDIDISPQLPAGKGQIYFRRDRKTGWSILYFAGIGNWETNYRVTLRKGAETAGGDSVSNLPYVFKFRSNRPVSFDERQGLTSPGYDEEERERARRKR